MELDFQDRKLLTLLQDRFPVVPQPFQELGTALDMSEDAVITRLRHLKESRVLRQVCGIFDSHRLGYRSTLVAMSLEPDRLDQAAAVVSRHPGVSHNYSRDHRFNLWFTLTLPPGSDLAGTVRELEEQTRASRTLNLPARRVFKIGVHFDLTGEDTPASATPQRNGIAHHLTSKEQQAVRALQQDLPLAPRPFESLARTLGVSEADLLGQAREFLRQGTMRRYGALLRHREVGFQANGMGTWIVPEDKAEATGQTMATFPGVTHCYQRPTYPDWPYSLFTMVHGQTRGECLAKLAKISQRTGVTDYEVLFSIKEYKKERVQYFV